MSAQTRTFKTPFANIACMDSGGAGIPLLMLHGSGASKSVFQRQFSCPYFAEYRLIAPDFPGHGESSNAFDPAAYSFGGYASAVSHLIDALGLERFAVFGWSLGGHVAMELLARQSGILGLVLCGAPPLGRGPLAMLRGFQPRWDMLLASKEHFSRSDCERFARLCFGDAPDPDFLNAVLRSDGRSRSHACRAMLRGEGIDQRRAVETASVPIALVNGAGEPFVRLSYLESLDIPNLWEGRCHTIQAAGHAPFWQQPEAFNDLLLRFMIDASEELASAPQSKAA